MKNQSPNAKTRSLVHEALRRLVAEELDASDLVGQISVAVVQQLAAETTCRAFDLDAAMWIAAQPVGLDFRKSRSFQSG